MKGYIYLVIVKSLLSDNDVVETKDAYVSLKEAEAEAQRITSSRLYTRAEVVKIQLR